MLPYFSEGMRRAECQMLNLGTSHSWGEKSFFFVHVLIADNLFLLYPVDIIIPMSAWSGEKSSVTRGTLCLVSQQLIFSEILTSLTALRSATETFDLNFNNLFDNTKVYFTMMLWKLCTYGLCFIYFPWNIRGICQLTELYRKLLFNLNIITYFVFVHFCILHCFCNNYNTCWVQKQCKMI